MLLNAFFLAFSASIDSLGVGITYGIKKTKISFLSTLVLFLLSLFVTNLSITFGNIISLFITDNFITIIGALMLCLIGIFIIFGSINDKTIHYEKKSKYKEYNFFIDFLGITINIIKNPINSDLDNSNIIDIKEAFFLGLALSLDSISIGFVGSAIGVNSLIFPLLISLFQIMFLSIGRFLGNKISNISKLPNNIWNIISGSILCIIGIMKLF